MFACRITLSQSQSLTNSQITVVSQGQFTKMIMIRAEDNFSYCCLQMYMYMYIFTVGRYHRDGWAEQTYSHLPGLPRNGAKPEQLAAVWMDPATGCTEGLEHITTLSQSNSVLFQKLVLDIWIKWSSFESRPGCDIVSRLGKWTKCTIFYVTFQGRKLNERQMCCEVPNIFIILYISLYFMLSFFAYINYL